MEGVIRRYSFKLYPNKTQADELNQIRILHCRLYNAALQERIDSYRKKDHAKYEIACFDTYITDSGEERGRYRSRYLSDGSGIECKTPTHFDQAKAIKIIRADDPAYEVISADSLSFTLKRLDMAYQAFFRRAKAGDGAQSGFPRFKRSEDYPGFTHRPGQGWKFDCKPGAGSGKTTIKGVTGAIKWRGQFPMFPYGIKTGDVMLRAGVWWLSVVANVPARMRADTNHSGEIKFDLVESFAHVSWADSGHPAGPKETVFTAANGRITPCVVRGYQASPEIVLQAEGDGGFTAAGALTLVPEVVLQTDGDDGKERSQHLTAWPEVVLQTEGDGGEVLDRQSTLMPEVVLQTEGDGGEVMDRQSTLMPEIVLQTEGDDENHKEPSLGKKIKRGSCKDRKHKLRDARKTARHARRRKDSLHVWTTGIAREFESLKIISPPLKEATKSGRGNSFEHGAEVALKAALNQRALDQAPGFAIAMLEYKIAERGGITETIVSDGPLMIGNEIVEARKATRKIKRKANASR